MLNCSDFVREYSDYRDGRVDPVRRAEMEAHLAGCSSCARYDRVVVAGVDELRSIPEIEPSWEFLPRLQHRIFHLEDGLSPWRRSERSAMSPAFVLLLVLLIGAAAWVPTLRRQAALVELAPVAAVAPAPEPDVHTLFREGPLLESRPVLLPLDSPSTPLTPTVFFRYTRLGSNVVYRTASVSPR